ncbi:MAG: ornithine cyclodeaminase family protein [Gaiellaceae bacterium]
MTLYLSEDDVGELLDAEEALAAIEACERRLAAGSVDVLPRERMRLDGGALAVMAAVDRELDLAALKSYVATRDGARFVVLLFDASRVRLEAVIDAARLGELRTGATSGVAARALARRGARTLGVIGCGPQARTQVDCIRAALPGIEHVLAYCRTRERLSEFCHRTGAEPVSSHQEAAQADVVVTVTSSPDPVLRGDWLREGALVCAVGANVRSHRELDNAVLQRASFVCCDLRRQAEQESGDLIEPIAAGVLDWLEVHELHEVVSGAVSGRQSDADIVVFKSNGIAAWDLAAAAAVLARARAQGRGREL